MIGNPVSMPRVIHLVDLYNNMAGKQKTFFVDVSEQAIMDWEILANHNGHIACTHGGESLAGLVAARKKGIINKNETGIVDSTAHALKFAGFQEMYFKQNFPPEFEIVPDQRLVNAPEFIRPKNLKKVPEPGKPLKGNELRLFINCISEEIAKILELEKV